MEIKEANRYESGARETQAAKDYRWSNIRIALQASLSQLFGAVLALGVGSYLAIHAISDAGEPNWDVLVSAVCLPLAVVAVAISALKFRTITRLIRQGWNSPTRRIQRPGKSEWDDFGPMR